MAGSVASSAVAATEFSCEAICWFWTCTGGRRRPLPPAESSTAAQASECLNAAGDPAAALEQYQAAVGCHWPPKAVTGSVHSTHDTPAELQTQE